MRKIVPIMAALALMSIPAQAAPPPVVISSLPFNVTAPGTYVLAHDMTYSSNYWAAITTGFAGPLTGSITIDFNGFTITCATPQYYTCIFVQANNLAIPVTIQNGTIQAFDQGISNNGLPTGPPITIRNMIFKQFDRAISLSQTKGSIIANCRFEGFTPPVPFNAAQTEPITGINDYLDDGGNTFTQNTFIGIYQPLIVITNETWARPLSLNNCQFYPSGAK